MTSQTASNNNTNSIPPENLVANFQIDFKSQLSEEILKLLVDFLNVQLKFTPQEFGNSKNDKGNELCTILHKKGFINSMENITTKFRDLLAKVNEDDRFDGLKFLYQWLEQWIAKPGFRSKNKSELAANVESKLFILMKKDLKRVKEGNKFIIHPLCTDRANQKIGDKLVLERVLEFLNQSKKKVLLILGNAGSGKSTCCQMILRELWDRYSSTEIGEGEIPLFASLPKIRDPNSIVSEFFDRNAEMVDKKEQLFLKSNRIAHFILDGYDELYSPVNLFGQTDLGEFNGKIIISCRNESRPDLNLLSPQPSEIMKLYLTPWTKTQIDKYITNQAIDPKNFQKIIQSIPSLKEFIQTPFHLKIITEILPQISEKLNDNRNVNRYEIYDLFVRNRINQAIQNRAPLNHLKTMKLTSPRLPDAVFQQCIEWSIQMRNQKSTTLSFNMTKSKIVKELRSLAGSETKQQILRWLSPLLIEENGDIVNCRFIHATVGEFFLGFQMNQIMSESKSSNEFTKEIKKHPIFSELLGISTWQFISDVIKSNQQATTQIWNLIELSKKSEEFSILAANCASIWNICGFSFSGKDLRNVKIPGAFLNRAIFYGADLRNANLKGCKLKDSILSEANLEGADLRDAKFGEMAPWKLDDLYNETIMHENQFIAINPRAKQVEIWNLSTRKLEFSWKWEFSFSASMKVINGTILMFVSYDNNSISFWGLKSGKLLFEHSGAFDKHELNADRSLMCSWSAKDRELTLWDLKTFKALWTTEYAQNIQIYIMELQFSLDNRYLLTCNDQKVIIFDVSNGKLLPQFQSLIQFRNCSFSSDGENIIGISKTELFCWNLNSQSYRSKKFDEFSTLICMWNISNQDGKDEILILDESGKLIFLNFKSFTIVKVISLVRCFNSAFSQDGTLFASTSIDGKFHLVDLKQRKLLHSIGTHDFKYQILSFSRDFIYSFENKQLIRQYLWDSEESINTLVRNSTQQVDSLHLTNSKFISQQFSTICARNCDSGQLQFTHYFDRTFFLYLGSCWCGKFFVTCSQNLAKNLEVSFWKVGAQSMSLHHKFELNFPNFSVKDSITCSSNGEVVVISISSTKPDTAALFFINIDSYSQSLQSLSDFTPNQKIFVTKEMIVSDSNFLTLKGEKVPDTLIGLFAAHEIRLETDFEVLVSKGNSIQLIDISTAVVILELTSSFSYPKMFYLCQRERFLVIGDEFGWLEIWDLSDQTIKTTLQVNERATAICASNDFSQLFIGTSNGSIWNFKLSKIESSNPKIELIWVHQPSLLVTNANLKGANISPGHQALLELHGLNAKMKFSHPDRTDKQAKQEVWQKRQDMKRVRIEERKQMPAKMQKQLKIVALKIREQTKGKSNQNYSTNKLLLETTGKLEDALDLFEQSLNYQETMATQKPNYLLTLGNLARMLSQNGKLEASLKYLEECLKIQEQTIGKQHPGYSSLLRTIGSILNEQGKYDEALKYFQEYLKIQEIGMQHPEYASTLHDMGSILDKRGKFTEALKCFQEYLKIQEQTIGTQHPNYAITLNKIGIILEKQGKFESLKYFEAYLKIQDLGNQNADYETTLERIRNQLEKKTNIEEVWKYFQECLEMQQQTNGKQRGAYESILKIIGQILNAHVHKMGSNLNEQGKHDEALKYFQECLKIQEQTIGNQTADYETTLESIRNVLEKKGNLDETFQDILKTEEQTIGKQPCRENPTYVSILTIIGEIFQKQGKFREAMVCFEECSKLRRSFKK